MSVEIFRPTAPTIPTVGEPAKVLGMTILVVVECKQCKAGENIALVNAQSAYCPSCGAMITLDRVNWDKHKPNPAIGLSATRPAELPKV